MAVEHLCCNLTKPDCHSYGVNYFRNNFRPVIWIVGWGAPLLPMSWRNSQLFEQLTRGRPAQTSGINGIAEWSESSDFCSLSESCDLDLNSHSAKKKKTRVLV